MKLKVFFNKFKAWVGKLPQYVWAAVGAGTVILIALIIAFSPLIGSFSPHSSGEHTPANALPQKVEYLPYFKDGAMYYQKDGNKITAAASIYDPTSDALVSDSNYAMDMDNGSVVYIETGADAALQFFNGTDTKLLGKQVLNFKTIKGLNTIAFVGKDVSSQLGFLYLYYNGKVTPIDKDITPDSIRFSQDGKYLFALKPNSSPGVQNRLMRYDMTGKSTILDNQCGDIIWISKDGKSFITGGAASDSTYNYKIYNNNGKKSIKISNIYNPIISADQSVLYVISDYDSTTLKGTLMAVDTATLKTKVLANDISNTNSAALTDISKGIVYDIKVSDDLGLYDIYYTDIKGNNLKLVKNAYESTLYSIALNTEKKQGFLLVQGSSIEKNGLYQISWSDKTLTSKTIVTGSIDGMVYFEKPNCVTFVKNPSANKAELYMVSYGGQPTLLTDDCAVSFDKNYSLFNSQSMVSNDGKKVMYFTDYAAKDDTGTDSSGTLMLLDTVTGAKVEVAKNVSTAAGYIPTMDATMTNIYYLVKNNDLYDLYYYNGADSTLIDSGTHGTVGISAG